MTECSWPTYRMSAPREITTTLRCDRYFFDFGQAFRLKLGVDRFEIGEIGVCKARETRPHVIVAEIREQHAESGKMPR